MPRSDRVVAPVVARVPIPIPVECVSGPWGVAMREIRGGTVVVFNTRLSTRTTLRIPRRRDRANGNVGLSAAVDGRMVSALSGGALTVWSANDVGEWGRRPRVVTSAGVPDNGHAIADGGTLWYLVPTGTQEDLYRLHVSTGEQPPDAVVAGNVMTGGFVVPIPGRRAVLVSSEGMSPSYSVVGYELVNGEIRATSVCGGSGGVLEACLVARSGRIAVAVSPHNGAGVLDVLDLDRGLVVGTRDVRLDEGTSSEVCADVGNVVMCGDAHAAVRMDWQRVAVAALRGRAWAAELQFSPSIEFEGVELLGTLRSHELVMVIDNGGYVGELCVVDVSAALVGGGG